MFSIIIYLFVCHFAATIGKSVDTKRTLTKRNDIDLQTCIDNFNILKDKIIRTQDSRNMGAKYLNEIDLGSREECLRLCCETDTCDVFVYEEKNPGSCYLFHCGPPEDFKCKFTQHANYSSAVLAVNRHLSELQNLKLTKHEQDLNSLRKNEQIRPQNVNRTVTKMTPTQHLTTTTQKSKEIPILPTKQTTNRRCSRYQFECRTSSECIAIYNACDGIPQCSDGSDEAPELGCPDSGTTPVPSPQPPPALPVIQNNGYAQAPQPRKPLPPMLPDNTYRSSNIQPDVRAPESHEVHGFLRPPQEPRAQQPVFNDASMMQNQPQQPYVANRPAVANDWIHQNNPMMTGMAQNPQYADKNSHIFNHKESGLQVMDTPDRYKYKGAMQTLHRAMAMGQYIDTPGGGASGAQYGDVRNDYSKVPNYYGDVYRSQYPVENWQQIPQSHVDNNLYTSNNDNWQPQYQQNDPNTQPYRPNVVINPNWKQDLLEKQAESKTFDHTIIKEPKDFEESPKKEPSHQKTKTEQPSPEKHVEKHKQIPLKEELKQTTDDLQDGEAERPGGAILSLTLGVCLTCIMAILIGCRLRVVRRRMRRGGKSPYAHDADYLVNGMYL